MPKTQPAPKHDDPSQTTVPAAESTPPGRIHTGPLSWALGGLTQAPRRDGPDRAERRRAPADQRPPAAADPRRRRSPSSGFRGNR